MFQLSRAQLIIFAAVSGLDPQRWRSSLDPDRRHVFQIASTSPPTFSRVEQGFAPTGLLFAFQLFPLFIRIARPGVVG